VISVDRDTICSGTPARINVTGNTGTIQWQSSTDGVNYTNIQGSTNSVYLGVLSQNTFYRTVATAGNQGMPQYVLRDYLMKNQVLIN